MRIDGGIAARGQQSASKESPPPSPDGVPLVRVAFLCPPGRCRRDGSWAPMVRAELPSFHGIIGRSAAMQALFRDVEDFASSNLPVLIRGESGTGKELVAAAIQRLRA